MTPSDQKQLAEKAAEFLKNAINENRLPVPGKFWQKLIFTRPVIPSQWFNEYDISPVLAHLAKREMEKREFDIVISSWRKGRMEGDEEECTGPPGYGVDIQHSKKHKICSYAENENEFRAFWLALEQAVKGGE